MMMETRRPLTTLSCESSTVSHDTMVMDSTVTVSYRMETNQEVLSEEDRDLVKSFLREDLLHSLANRLCPTNLVQRKPYTSNSNSNNTETDTGNRHRSHRRRLELEVLSLHAAVPRYSPLGNAAASCPLTKELSLSCDFLVNDIVLLFDSQSSGDVAAMTQQQDMQRNVLITIEDYMGHNLYVDPVNQKLAAAKSSVMITALTYVGDDAAQATTPDWISATSPSNNSNHNNIDNNQKNDTRPGFADTVLLNNAIMTNNNNNNNNNNTAQQLQQEATATTSSGPNTDYVILASMVTMIGFLIPMIAFLLGRRYYRASRELDKQHAVLAADDDDASCSSIMSSRGNTLETGEMTSTPLGHSSFDDNHSSNNRTDTTTSTPRNKGDDDDDEEQLLWNDELGSIRFVEVGAEVDDDRSILLRGKCCGSSSCKACVKASAAAEVDPNYLCPNYQRLGQDNDQVSVRTFDMQDDYQLFFQQLLQEQQQQQLHSSSSGSQGQEGQIRQRSLPTSLLQEKQSSLPTSQEQQLEQPQRQPTDPPTAPSPSQAESQEEHSYHDVLPAQEEVTSRCGSFSGIPPPSQVSQTRGSRMRTSSGYKSKTSLFTNTSSHHDNSIIASTSEHASPKEEAFRQYLATNPSVANRIIADPPYIQRSLRPAKTLLL
jgi:hypothetical protein